MVLGSNLIPFFILSYTCLLKVLGEHLVSNLDSDKAADYRSNNYRNKNPAGSDGSELIHEVLTHSSVQRALEVFFTHNPDRKKSSQEVQ